MNIFQTNSSSVTVKKFTGFQTSFSISDDQNIEKFGWGAVLDVETTGINPLFDEVIQLGLRLFQFERTNLNNIKIGESFLFYNEPKKGISEKITRLTGITERIVKGSRIPWKKLFSILDRVEVIVSHNAAFDRPFIDREVKGEMKYNWACSCHQINWLSKGFSSTKLEMLCVFSGFFGNFHSADGDVDLLLNLLTRSSGKKSLFEELLINSQKPLVRSEITDFPYGGREQLKKIGYRWDPRERMWYQVFYKDDYPSHSKILDILSKELAFNYTSVSISTDRKFASLKESVFSR